MNVSATPELRFHPFRLLIEEKFGGLDGILGEAETPEFLNQVTAEIYAIAYQTVADLQALFDNERAKNTRLRKLRDQLKEDKRELEDKVVELDRRLRDPNRLRPDPLGPSLSRGGQPKLVIEPPPKEAEWCPGSWAKAKLINKKDIAFKCDRCGRMMIPRQGYTDADGVGQVPRHKWGGRFSA